eukprot:scpid74688/ scgid6782/ Homeobox protein PKNOX2; PBX/knotted homeobox 2
MLADLTSRQPGASRWGEFPVVCCVMQMPARHASADGVSPLILASPRPTAKLLSPNSVLETGSSMRDNDVSVHPNSSSGGRGGHDMTSSSRHSHHTHHSHHSVTTVGAAHQDRGYHHTSASSASYHTMSGYGSDGGAAGDARLLPVRVRRVRTKILRQWMIDNKNHPYPSREEKEYLASQCDMTVVQVSTWFANSRRRIQRIGLQGWVNDQVREDEKLHKDKQPTWS